jgi:NodT family efflux transporter outer membrane factor (OMF) lipoprotein
VTLNKGQTLNFTPRKILIVLAAGGACLALTACSFEPKLHVPRAPNTIRYNPGQKLTTTGKTVARTGDAGSKQHFVYGARVKRLWWQLFKSHAMDHLVSRAIAHNPSIKLSEANLSQAYENLKSVEGIFWPQVSLNAGGQRERQSGQAFGGPSRTFNLYTGQLEVSYTPDIFGLNRLVSRSFKAQQDAQRYALQEAYLTVEGDTVVAAIAVAELHAEIRTTRSLIRDQERILNLILQQYKLGAVPYLDVVNQQSQLASTQATLPPLLQSFSAERNALAILLGRIPSLADLPKLDIRTFSLPVRLPVSLPSSLVHQRPDILSAEAQLRVANAAVGEAIAKMYPLVQLTGAVGFESGDISHYFDASSLIWSVAGTLAVTIFDGGTLQANKKAAQFALKSAVYSYKSVVLNAFNQVATALRAVEHDAQSLQYNEAAYLAAKKAYRLSQYEYRYGSIDYITLLTSEIQYQQSRLAIVRAAAQRYADTAGLFVALGGGWWPKADASAEQKKWLKLATIARRHATMMTSPQTTEIKNTRSGFTAPVYNKNGGSLK